MYNLSIPFIFWNIEFLFTLTISTIKKKKAKETKSKNFSWTYRRTEDTEQTGTLIAEDRGKYRESARDLLTWSRSRWSHKLVRTSKWRVDELLKLRYEINETLLRAMVLGKLARLSWVLPPGTLPCSHMEKTKKSPWWLLSGGGKSKCLKTSRAFAVTKLYSSGGKTFTKKLTSHFSTSTRFTHPFTEEGWTTRKHQSRS